VVSEAVLTAARYRIDGDAREVPVRGREEALSVVVVKNLDELQDTAAAKVE
jgi:hypothetical protein